MQTHFVVSKKDILRFSFGVFFRLFIFLPSAGAAGNHTSESQVPYDQKCFKEAQSWKANNCTESPNEVFEKQNSVFKNCARDANGVSYTQQVNINYINFSSEGALKGESGCAIIEDRTNFETKEKEKKQTILTSKGTRKVIYRDKDNKPVSQTIYTKDGLVVCNNFNSSTSKFDTCKLADPERPSTNSGRPYWFFDAKLMNSDTDQALLSGKSISEIFPKSVTDDFIASQSAAKASPTSAQSTSAVGTGFR